MEIQTLHLQQGKSDEGSLKGLFHVCRVGSNDGSPENALPVIQLSLHSFHHAQSFMSIPYAETRYPRPSECHSGRSRRSILSELSLCVHVVCGEFMCASMCVCMEAHHSHYLPPHFVIGCSMESRACILYLVSITAQ